MTKKEFFQAVRSYIEANAVEPRAGFRANVLKFQVGEYTLIVEHRQRGTGIVSVQHGYTYALIEQSMHPGKWSDTRQSKSWPQSRSPRKPNAQPASGQVLA